MGSAAALLPTVPSPLIPVRVAFHLFTVKKQVSLGGVGFMASSRRRLSLVVQAAPLILVQTAGSWLEKTSRNQVS